ncbi:hypothetical protein [Arthrobacter sp. B0490]|uniref:hypothetical protein n=1 Tax=Arthrobacter sp. B0490 TaxID=2058891 RepID=UPI000CE56531|nr:hypothetical protein [Arthrobacter sp. B0490]
MTGTYGQDEDRNHDDDFDRDELMGAALAHDLDAGRQKEFEDLCSRDGAFLDEYQALSRLATRFSTPRPATPALQWDDPDIPAGLEDRIVDAIDQDTRTRSAPDADALSPLRSSSSRRRAGTSRTPDSSRPSKPSARRGRLIRGAALAASLLAVGALGGAGITHLVDRPPAGPPGTLGAVEDIVLTDTPQGARVDAELVAHTWGTETILEIDGLLPGRVYDVVLVREDGKELLSGTFLGAEQTITCRMNAAVLREDLARLQVRDAQGAIVAASDVTPV